ncbi:urease accessory protein [Marinobacterium zhoushanense]|uniref:Urease accessory protein n=1 Tax=Marinobacterium zhoushanense TaxID=1679163 RepID=A0ABQ1K102_9GAMM|nr:HupE/UreJ family protein [Marinobacterium zhoushanense]GGB79881.1 urease accessory protein [Marinobacterium zhoushanense]
MKRHALTLCTLAALSLSPSLAFAHTSTGTGLASGLLHPLMGADHLLAMLAIGVWAALQPGQMRFAIPGALMLALLAGFGAALSGFALPMVEGGIALSVLLLGILITTMVRLPASAALLLTALFALFHGFAHGHEASGSLTLFAVGFMATSAILHFGGSLAGHHLRALPILTRSAGAAIAVSGLIF